MDDAWTPPTNHFALRLTATPEDIDELGHVNNAVWVQWIQLVATAHWLARAGAAEQAALVWVVVRHEIDYLRPLLSGQSITARSWVAEEAQGAKFERLMIFCNDDGQIHARARTIWALLDRESRRPMRVHQPLIDLFRQAAPGASVPLRSGRQ